MFSTLLTFHREMSPVKEWAPSNAKSGTAADAGARGAMVVVVAVAGAPTVAVAVVMVVVRECGGGGGGARRRRRRRGGGGVRRRDEERTGAKTNGPHQNAHSTGPNRRMGGTPKSEARCERVSHAKGCRTKRAAKGCRTRKGVARSGRGRIVDALRGRCEAASRAATTAAGGATVRPVQTTGALTSEWSGSVEKCECRGGNVAPPGCLAEANLPHWLLIGGGRHGRLSHVPRVAELTEADPQLRYSTRRNHATHVASNFPPCMSVPMSRGTEYGAKIAFFFTRN